MNLLDKIKQYRSAYLIGSEYSFLDWLNNSLKEAKDISNNDNFKRFLISTNIEPFIFISDKYDGMPYNLYICNSFSTNESHFVIAVSFEEK